jgi:hypothetical protein
MPTLNGPFQWGEETHAKLADCESAISRLLAEHLCDADAGSVEIGGESFNISVSATVLTPEGEKRLQIEEHAGELLAALKFAADLIPVARQRFPASIHNRDRFKLEQTCAAINSAIAKATG